MPGELLRLAEERAALRRQESILDINATVRPQLAIVDGIVGMEGDGPILGTPKTAGVLVVGTSLPAVDASAARVMGLDPAHIRYLAEAAGWLGVDIADEAIHQVGENLADVRTPFQLVENIGAQSAARPGVGGGVLEVVAKARAGGCRFDHQAELAPGLGPVARARLPSRQRAASAAAHR